MSEAGAETAEEDRPEDQAHAADTSRDERSETGGGDDARTRQGAGTVALGKHIRIDPRAKLPQFSRPHAEAFAASDGREPSRALYAMVFDERLAPRQHILSTLSRIEGIPLVLPVDWGIVVWGGKDTRRFAIVLEQPAGAPLASAPDGHVQRMREERIIERIIVPMARVLRELSSRGITHRAIAAHNVFLTAAGGQDAVLGECVSMPAGVFQPTVFETIQGGQANPAGRGMGTVADDLYALGVVLALLVRGSNPLAGLSDRDIVAEKIENGSYGALLGHARVSLKMMEPLRGLLCDDVAERWTVEDLEMWLNGRQLSPKQTTLPPKARRAFYFNGTPYWSCRALAHALANDWPNALRAVASGEVVRWAVRSLDDDKHAKLIQATVALGQSGQGGGGDDRTLSRLLIALDPEAPVYLRDTAVRVDALGQALALMRDDADHLKRLIEMIRAKLPERWIEAQPEADVSHPQLVHAFERLLFFLDRSQPGYGLERAIYEYNANVPCLSPLVEGTYVHTLERLLPALEHRAARGTPESAPMDPHIAGFCAARMDAAIERILQGLATSADDVTRRRATLHLLARLQNRHGPAKLPALTGWVAKYVQPIVDALHNRKVREGVQQQVARAVESGSLVALVSAADDPAMRQSDLDGFVGAQHEYARLSHEIAWLEDGGLTSDANVAQGSRSVATAVSAVCSGLLFVLLTIFYAM